MAARVLWLSIGGATPLHLYADPAALAYMPAGERSAQLLQDVGDIDGSVADLNPDLTVTLSNGAGEACALLFRNPRLGAPAVLYAGAEPLFAGVIDAVALGETATITVVA